jgi:hypothetical protein
MQPLKFRDIVRKAAKESNIEEDMLQSMSEFVFRECKEEMGKFNNLSVYFKGFFTWFYGRKRLSDLRDRIDRLLEMHSNKTLKPILRKSFLSKMRVPELQELRIKVEQRLLQYEDYVQEKKDIRHANYLQTVRGGPEPPDVGNGECDNSNNRD